MIRARRRRSEVAEDRRFELLKGCPQHAFQQCWPAFTCVRYRPPPAGTRLLRVLAVLSAGGDGWSSARLCGACPEIVGVSGAGVMLMSGEIPRGSLCATDDVSQLIEDLQYTLGEGPCLDAYQQDKVVAEPDLAGPVTRRWPAFTPPAVQAGVRAVFGFPLRAGTVRLGALNLYRDWPGPLTGDQHADALVVAEDRKSV